MSLLERIWDTITIYGLGGLLKPWQIGRTSLAEANANRKKMLIEAQTEMDIMKVKNGTVAINDKGEMIANENEKLIQLMLDDEKMQILRRKINLLKTLDKTFLLLEDNIDNCDETSEKPTEEWFERWREYSEKANIEEIQVLWAKILNQEIRYGGSISLRTLDFLKSISRKEAKMIEKVFTFAFQNFLIHHVSNKEFGWAEQDTTLAEMGITEGMLMELQYLNILSDVDSMGVYRNLESISNIKYLVEIVIGKHIITIMNDDIKRKISLCAYRFTVLGMELMGILGLDRDMEYFNVLFNKLKSVGYEVIIK